eukprot:CAMPEP_0202509244 /NCGR_PEP_ID=MMETSP1361-20130828/52672_1 /ASSEMBLY_ACC=CAM_ASM_000849 /TAXON_ID=210615 /ORGANISM="Staurosira complex sp., Strain CCMP2646" /LENGTH=461 /DNA_ID=CAMNT_0049143457 /DNA_START=173 /DNA_END=1558 /DNA_ORIENTATION=+
MKRNAWILLFLMFACFLFTCFLRFYYSTQSSFDRAVTIANKLELTYGRLPTDDQLQQLNTHLNKLSVEEVLLWAYRQFSSSLVDVTSFGPSGLVILHKLQQLDLLPSIPVVTIDTLHLFTETYDFIQELKQSKLLHNANLYVYQPRSFSTREDFDKAFGKDLYKTNPEKYAYLSKVEPTLSALDDTRATAWITGRRRSQGGERTHVDILEIDDWSHSINTTTSISSKLVPRYKLNPLAFWTYSQVWDYIHKYNIPYNKLHDKGYKSIGDVMNTAPVAHNASERSGRFVGLANITECGIHATRTKIITMKQQAEAQGHEYNGVADLPSCGENCIQVNESTFEKAVMQGKTDMLLEFYSPMCGACQAFAPKFHEIGKSLQPFQQLIQLARFDITEEDVPKSGQDAGFVVSVTPSLFLVRRNPLRVVPYQGSLSVNKVVKWIRKECQYDVKRRRASIRSIPVAA